MIETNRIPFLNTYVDNLTMGEAQLALEKLVEEPGFRYVVSPNTDIVVKMQDDKELKSICESADMILTDGQVLVNISKKIGIQIKERVAMTDFVWSVFELAENKGYKIFFLGGEEAILQKAVENVEKKFPILKIAGVYSPPIGFEKDLLLLKETNEKIKKSGADILLVFLGCPKQEKFIANNKDIYEVSVSITMGGCVDFLAGKVRRAPKWMQNAGLEWFYRFLQEPRRMFKRYFIDDIKIFKIKRRYK